MPEGLYETDFHAWALAQAAALREAATRQLDADIDWANVAEEIESIGSEQAYALESALLRTVEYLVKLEHSPAAAPRRKWWESAAYQRVEVSRRLQHSPSLNGILAELFSDAWRYGRILAAHALAAYDGIDPETIPTECPYTLDQVQSLDWWPVNRHGLLP